MIRFIKIAIRSFILTLTGIDVVKLRQLPNLEYRTSEIERRTSEIEHHVSRFRTRVYMSRNDFLPNIAAGKFSYGYEEQDVVSSYRDFEDIFRGSEIFIKDRFCSYDNFFNIDDYVLEIGCGRGEFLELLAEKGVRYVGVDLDESMVLRCQEKGLAPIIHKDFEDFLDESDSSIFDGIFSAQFIEHIPSDKVLDFFKKTHIALKSGGVLIAETVNPYSIEAFRTFHVDLTHQKILYPEVLLYLSKVAGFRKASIYYPNNNGFDETQYDIANEYAIIAYK